MTDKSKAESGVDQEGSTARTEAPASNQMQLANGEWVPAVRLTASWSFMRIICRLRGHRVRLTWRGANALSGDGEDWLCTRCYRWEEEWGQ